MAKPPIEYRPSKSPAKGDVDSKEMVAAALEAYKAELRAKVLARVRKHRAKKAGKP